MIMSVAILTFPMLGQASLMLTLSDNGSGGTNAWFFGSGTTSGVIGNSAFFENIGEYNKTRNFGTGTFTLASLAGFNPSTSITGLYIDHDNGFGLDDIAINFNRSVGTGEAYNINFQAEVVGLTYDYLKEGTFSGSLSQSVSQLGGFSLVIGKSGFTAVPEPSTLAIFALGMIGLASRRFKKQS
jgi:hypothetical protein